ncbi:DUF4826 family protein [Pseudoalteromonas fenneropenaei]|uniref:DUF4826 family protein n=1 Tax=Pseudoalteromonas fenneropenaei TaxID=1737459 RepID=A0ABV7CFA4_9GAMM
MNEQQANEQQVDLEELDRAWQREAFQAAQKHLAEKGIMPHSVFDKESRFLAPLCAVWKFKAQDGKKYWVITGRLPADAIEVSGAANARDALRAFSLRWQLKAEQIIQTGITDQTQADYVNLLVNRAQGLYEVYEKDHLWANEPV